VASLQIPEFESALTVQQPSYYTASFKKTMAKLRIKKTGEIVQKWAKADSIETLVFI
jgi:hypothetical protein